MWLEAEWLKIILPSAIQCLQQSQMSHLAHSQYDCHSLSVSLSFPCPCHLYASYMTTVSPFFLTTFSFLTWSCPAYYSFSRTTTPLGSSRKLSVEQPATHTHSSSKEQTSQECIGWRVQDITFNQNKPKPKWFSQGHKPCIAQCPVAQEGKEGKNSLHYWSRTSEGQHSRSSHSLLKHCCSFI